MAVDADKLLGAFKRNPPVSERAIEDFQKATSLKLPDDYVWFLKSCNGGEGFIGESYAMLWPVEDLARLNSEYQVQEYAPGFLLIGSNGGGEAFAYDTRDVPWPLVQVPFVGMDPEAAEVLGNGFHAFLEALYLAA